MGDDNPRIRDPPFNELEISLLEKLTEPVHSNMDLMQFLVATGLSYRLDELETTETRILREHVKTAYHSRREQLSRRQKAVERRIANAIDLEYGLEDPPVHTIRDFKNYIESKPRAPPVPQLSVISHLYLNTVLEHHGLPSIAIRSREKHETALKEIGKYVPHSLALPRSQGPTTK